MACDCGLPDEYDACCGRFHAGADAPTAELLMRSRYSAYVRRDVAYLLRTWAAENRPRKLRLDPTRWTGLVVHGATGGGLFEQTGTVDFTASYEGGSMRENSLFRRENGAWLYVAALP